MRVLYLGANLRMRMTTHSAPEMRAFGLKQGLEAAGVEVLMLMAGDQLDLKKSRTVYSKGLKRFLPKTITAPMRDLYEIFLDQRLYQSIEQRVREIHPDIILQKQNRYSQVGIKLSRKLNIPIFLDDITPIWEGEVYSGRSLKWIARNIRKKVFSQATGLMAVSPDMATRLCDEGVPVTKIHFVPNGVNCAQFNPALNPELIRQKYGLKDKVVIGYVGGFQGWHRLDLLINIAPALIEQCPAIHFLLIGNDFDQQVEKMTQELGIRDRFTFSGEVPQSEVPMYLNAMDITVLPSTLSYMSPMKIYEYMAMGKPVIAPSGNSIVDAVVIPSKTGLIFEGGNVDSLQEAILSLVRHPDFAKNMGANAREIAERTFSWECQVKNLLKAFNDACPRISLSGVPLDIIR